MQTPTDTPSLSPVDAGVVRRWAADDGPAAAITRLVDPAHPLDAPLAAFARSLTALAPRLRLAHEADPPPEPGPGLRLGADLVFHLLPAGPELPVFLAALRLSADPPPPPAPLAGLDLPAGLDLFVGPGCPVCPEMVRRLVPAAVAPGRLRLAVIDAAAFPAAAARHRVRATPTLVLDGRFRWTGLVDPGEVWPVVMDRDPSRLGPAALETMLAEGEADRLAGMMIAAGRAFDALAELLTHPRWPVRLGAMVAVETLAERRPDLAADLVPVLLERYPGCPDAVRGDLLYVLGSIAAPADRPAIERLTAGESDPDVCEAAAEALAALGEK